MASLDDHPDQLALDELAQIAAVNLAQDRERLMHLGVELGSHILPIEGHGSGGDQVLLMNGRSRPAPLDNGKRYRTVGPMTLPLYEVRAAETRHCCNHQTMRVKSEARISGLPRAADAAPTGISGVPKHAKRIGVLVDVADARAQLAQALPFLLDASVSGLPRSKLLAGKRLQAIGDVLVVHLRRLRCFVVEGTGRGVSVLPPQVPAQLPKRRVAGVLDMPIDELGQPGVADAGRLVCGDGLPVAATRFEQSLDLDVERFIHAETVAKYCSVGKQPIALVRRNSEGMDTAPTEKRPITDVIAENLTYWMEQSETLKTQSALAKAAGVAQTTISNYLNPSQRLGSASGKAPSPKVTELAQIATALGIEVWNLLRDMTPRERAFYGKVEEAYRVTIETDPDGFTGNTRPGSLEESPQPKRSMRPAQPPRLKGRKGP